MVAVLAPWRAWPWRECCTLCKDPRPWPQGGGERQDRGLLCHRRRREEEAEPGEWEEDTAKAFPPG